MTGIRIGRVAEAAPCIGRAAGAALFACVSCCYGAFAASSAWVPTDAGRARLVSAVAAVGGAESLRLGLQFELDDKWKIYWRSPGDSGSPPAPDFVASGNVAAVDVAWPAPQRFYEYAGLETAGYAGGTLLPLSVRPERPGEPVRLRATVPYQACDDRICVPFVAELALDLPRGDAAATPFARLIERYAARVPGPPEAAGVEGAAPRVVGEPPDERVEVAFRSPIPFAAPELFVEAPPGFRVPASAAILEDEGRRVRIAAPVEARGGLSLAGQTAVFTVVDGGRAFEFAAAPERAAPAPALAPAISRPLALMLGIALLGGLILNLMPCVLPVLSLKLLGAVGHGGGAPGAVRLGFLASAAGVVVSFLVLAAAAVGAKLAGGAVGWGIQFQQPAFLVFMTLVLCLFAYNLFGLFEIPLPSWAGAAARGGGGPAGHFAAGAFATLLATPCSAPFLGTAVSFALSRGPVEIFAIFAALGIGMAAPYLAVAAFPRAVTRLPRPGLWMLWVKAALGAALLGTAAWLVFVLAVQVPPAAALAVAAAGAFMVPALRLARRGGRTLRAAGAAALAALAAAAFAAPLLAPAGLSTGAGAGPRGDGHWRPFEAPALRAAVAEGKTVFVDVTADWCVTCKVNKLLVLDAEPVRARLRGASVVAMRADWTRPDPGIAAYLGSFDRFGIPFNAVYGPSAPGGIVLPELLRTDAVLDAIDRAG